MNGLLSLKGQWSTVKLAKTYRNIRGEPAGSRSLLWDLIIECADSGERDLKKLIDRAHEGRHLSKAAPTNDRAVAAERLSSLNLI